jgi:hypothetical protein
MKENASSLDGMVLEELDDCAQSPIDLFLHAGD